MFPICNDVGEVIAFSGRILATGYEIREISELAGDAIVSQRQRPLRSPQDQTGADRRKERDRMRRPVGSDHALRSRHHERGRATRHRVYRSAGADSEAFCDQVILCFDADVAGQKAAERSLDSLLQNDLVVRIVEMPPGEDPDSIVRSKGKIEFETRVAQAKEFFDYWIERETATPT